MKRIRGSALRFVSKLRSLFRSTRCSLTSRRSVERYQARAWRRKATADSSLRGRQAELHGLKNKSGRSARNDNHSLLVGGDEGEDETVVAFAADHLHGGGVDARLGGDGFVEFTNAECVCVD